MPKISNKFVQLRRIVVDGSIVERSLVLSRDARHIRITEPRCGLGQFVKDALKIKTRATYKLKHVGSGGLLFERFVTLAGKPRDVGFWLSR
jgi:hypothetical protein